MTKKIATIARFLLIVQYQELKQKNLYAKDKIKEQ